MSTFIKSVAANDYVGNNLANQWYGIQFTPGQALTTLTPIAGDDSLLITMPVHNDVRHAVVNDDRTPNYWLDNIRLDLKANGDPADLSGADGQVMGLIPSHYRKIWLANGKENWAVSLFPLKGFTHVPARWYATFPATLATGDKLESVAGKYAQTSKTPVQFLQYARNRSADWYPITYPAVFDLAVLIMIETANFDFQTAVSQGLTNANSTDWNNFNAYNPLYLNGLDKSTEVLTGQSSLVIENFVGGVSPLNTQVAVYRQWRLLTGVFEFLAGLNIFNSVENGAQAYVCDTPADLAYNTTVGHTFLGNLAEADGYIKEMLTGSLLPKVVGGSSSTYYADYHNSNYDNDPASGWRVALWFGIAYGGGGAGLACSLCSSSSGDANVNLGSRLCCFANV